MYFFLSVNNFFTISLTPNFMCSTLFESILDLVGVISIRERSYFVRVFLIIVKIYGSNSFIIFNIFCNSVKNNRKKLTFSSNTYNTYMITKRDFFFFCFIGITAFKTNPPNIDFFIYFCYPLLPSIVL